MNRFKEPDQQSEEVSCSMCDIVDLHWRMVYVDDCGYFCHECYREFLLRRTEREVPPRPS